MPPAIPTAEPEQAIAGDTLQWDKQVADYSAADGWQLSYTFQGTEKIDLAWGTEVVAHPNGRDFRVTVLPAKTAAATPGTFKWQAYVTKGSERHTVDAGVLVLLANFATATAGSQRTHAEKTLSVIKAAIEGRITSDIENYQIHGRAVSKIPVEQLVKLRGIYEAMVYRERHPGLLMTPVEVVFTNPD
jgi:hypothetical protein